MAGTVVGVVDQGREEKLLPYLEALAAAGAEHRLLRWQEPRDPAADARVFDALVLCGGDDVDPRHFGEPSHPRTRAVPPERDRYEIALVRVAAERDVPLLAVCRGCQVVNVAFGGTLEQHVPDVPGRGLHGDGARHEVEIGPGSLLATLGNAANGALRVTVNSYHHQAVGRVAPGLRVTAKCGDGGVEAIEGPGRFVVGVQWHPERDGCDEPYGRGLFRALVAAAARK